MAAKQLTDGQPVDVDEKKAIAAQARKDARILKEVSELRKLAAAFVERLADLEERVAHGQNSTNAIRLEFISIWERHEGTPSKYLGNVAEDNKAIKRLRSQMDDRDLRARMALFFADNGRDAEWIEGQAWSLRCFAQLANKLGSRAAKRRRSGRQTADADLFEVELARTGRKGPT